LTFSNNVNFPPQNENSLMKITHPGKPSQIAFAVVVCLAVSQQAFANITSNDGSGIVSATAQGATSVTTAGPVSSGTINSSVTEGSFQDFAGARNFLEIDGARYGGSSYAAGTSSSFSEMYKKFVFTAEFAGNYTMNSYIYGGRLTSAATGGATGSGSASYLWDLSVNGTSQHSSAVSVFNDGANSSTSATGDVPIGGVNFSNTAFSQSASWQGSSVDTNIGYLGAGDSVTVTFFLSTSSQADYALNAPDYYNNFNSYGCQYGGLCAGSAVAFGDPSAFYGNADNYNTLYTSAGVFAFEVAAIPEPGEWAMMLVGLASVGAIARRRKKQSN
jgi:hypothetical protein